MTKQKSLGFSLPEVLVATAMVAILATFSASVISNFMKIGTAVQNETSRETDASLAAAYLSKQFRIAKPSFNNLIGTLDDNGNEFFDYYSDVPSDQWPSESDRTRKLTLSEASGKNAIYVFIEDEKQKSTISYDPRSAYADVDPVIEMDQSAVLVYEGLNYSDILKNRYPELWIDKQIFLIKSPISLRYVAADGTVSMDPGSVPRELSFIGVVSGSTLTANSFPADLTSRLWNRNPIDGAAVDNPDVLLRRLPSIGGAAPLVTLDAIRILKIFLQKNDQGAFDLYSTEFINGSFSSKNIISTNVKELIISRDSVSRTILSFKLTLN